MLRKVRMFVECLLVLIGFVGILVTTAQAFKQVSEFDLSWNQTKDIRFPNTDSYTAMFSSKTESILIVDGVRMTLQKSGDLYRGSATVHHGSTLLAEYPDNDGSIRVKLPEAGKVVPGWSESRNFPLSIAIICMLYGLILFITEIQDTYLTFTFGRLAEYTFFALIGFLLIWAFGSFTGFNKSETGSSEGFQLNKGNFAVIDRPLRGTLASNGLFFVKTADGVVYTAQPGGYKPNTHGVSVTLPTGLFYNTTDRTIIFYLDKQFNESYRVYEDEFVSFIYLPFVYLFLSIVGCVVGVDIGRNYIFT